jgi:hypothetical protein
MPGKRLSAIRKYDSDTTTLAAVCQSVREPEERNGIAARNSATYGEEITRPAANLPANEREGGHAQERPEARRLEPSNLRRGDHPVRSEFASDRESATICLRERGSGQAERRIG